MRRPTSMGTIACLLMSLISPILVAIPTALAAPPAGFSGTGTDIDPFLITDCESLEYVDGVHSGSSGYYFELGNDIDCSADGTFMIGDSLNNFDDYFDGGGYTITIDFYSEDSYTGLFSYTEDATIHDVNLTGTVEIAGGGTNGALIGTAEDTSVYNTVLNINMPTNGDNIGALAGYFHGGLIENVDVTGTITGLDNVGALAGNIACETEIIDVTIDADVTGTYSVGGMVGYDGGECFGANVYDSTVEGTVEGVDYVGGVFGTAYYNYMDNVSSEASVTGEAGVGGLAGQYYYSTINESNSTGNINGLNYTGGLLGYAYSLELANSYSSSDVVITTEDEDQGYSIGGLIGFAESEVGIENTYSEGTITITVGGSLSTEDVGGLVGSAADYLYITDSHSTSDINIEVIEPEIKYISDIGGLVGSMCTDDYDCNIDTSYYSGDIYIDLNQSVEPELGFSAQNIGGLVGYIAYTDSDDLIDQNYSLGNITVEVTDQYVVGQIGNVGGLIGLLDVFDESNPYITNNYSRMNIDIDTPDLEVSYVGGFMGWNNSGTPFVIADNYAANQITVNAYDATYIAGFIGTDEVSNSIYYNNFAVPTFDISVSDSLTTSGAFFGYNDDFNSENVDNNYVYDINNEFSYCYGSFPEETSGCSFADFEEDFKLDEFELSEYTIEPLASWDFEDIWGFEEDFNDEFPILLNTSYEAQVPVVTTNAATDITATGATLNATVDSGDVDNALFGFFVSEQENAAEWFFAVPGPIEVLEAGDSYEFDATELELDCNTTYYAMAMGEYYIDSYGLFVADNEISFTTLACEEE